MDNIIFWLHALMFATLLVAPFINDQYYLEFYSILIPFIFFHWSINDDTCALTILEQQVTGKHKDETFFGRLMKGIYKMEDTDANNFFKSTMFFLWMFVQYRLHRFDLMFGDLKSILHILPYRL